MEIIEIKSFDGDVVIVPRTSLDEFFSQVPLNDRDFAHAMWIDTQLGLEGCVTIYDDLGNEKGFIHDYRGGCEVCVFNKNELFSLLKVSSNSELLDLFHKLDRNPNIKRYEIEPSEEYSMLYELENFKGVISCIDYDEDEYEDLLNGYKPWIIAKIDGIDTKTGKDIHYVINNH